MADRPPEFTPQQGAGSRAAAPTAAHDAYFPVFGQVASAYGPTGTGAGLPATSVSHAAADGAMAALNPSVYPSPAASIAAFTGAQAPKDSGTSGLNRQQPPPGASFPPPPPRLLMELAGTAAPAGAAVARVPGDLGASSAMPLGAPPLQAAAEAAKLDGELKL
jgi:hypothetical protein